MDIFLLFYSMAIAYKIDNMYCMIACVNTTLYTRMLVQVLLIEKEGQLQLISSSSWVVQQKSE
jgi:hypothetical protein